MKVLSRPVCIAQIVCCGMLACLGLALCVENVRAERLAYAVLNAGCVSVLMLIVGFNAWLLVKP